MVNKLLERLSGHFGKVFGSTMGLLIGWIIIRYGVFKGLFVALCVVAGFYLGARFDSPNEVTDVTSRFLR